MMTAPAIDMVDVSDELSVDELKPGTQLLHGQFTIDAFLNSGGFGITYLARDSLNRKVIIKECFPGSFCRRSNAIVRARSRAHQAEFRSIVKLFVREAFSLSKLKHPYIVGVHQVFEDNDTAYIAMDYVDGFDLLETLQEGATRLGPDKISELLQKMLDAVGFVHSHGVLHCDISPDNILMDKSTGNPVLIDFGAAREDVSKASRALSALRVVKDGYSPHEFYINGSEQGPYSDLYALAATFYHLITGRTPVNSQARLSAIASGDADPYRPLLGHVTGYTPAFLTAIDKALNIRPKDRIQSTDAWLAMINPGADEVNEAVSDHRPRSKSAAAGTLAIAPTTAARSPKKMLAASGAVIGLVVGLAAWQGGLVADQMDDATGESVSPAEASPAVTVVAAIDPSATTTPDQSGDAVEATVAMPVPVQAAAPAATSAADEVAAVAESAAVMPPASTKLTLTRVVSMPFSTNATQKNLIEAVLPGAPVWMQPGQRIVDINGAPVRSSDDLREIVGRDIQSGSRADVRVIFGMQAVEGADIIYKTELMPVVNRVAFDTGLEFEVRETAAGHQTVVTAVPAGPEVDLKVGDVIVAYTATQQRIDGATTLADVLLGEIEKKVAKYSFAVQRDGAMVMAFFTLTIVG